MATIHVSSIAGMQPTVVEYFKNFSRTQRVSVNFAEQNISHIDPLTLGEYFDAKEVLHYALNKEAPKLSGPLGDLVTRIKAVADRQFKDCSLTFADEFKKRIETYLEKGFSVHIGCPKSARLLELAGMENWADGFRFLVVNSVTGKADVEFFAPKYEDSAQKTIIQTVHRIENLGDFDKISQALDITPVSEIPTEIPHGSNLRFAVGSGFFDDKGKLNLHRAYRQGEFVTLYHGSQPLKVHESLLIDQRFTVEPSQILIKGAKPAVLAGFKDDVPAREKLKEVIAGRRVIAVSGSAMSLQAAQDPQDYGAFTNKSHIANSIGVARSLMDLWKTRFETSGEETVFISGSMAYHNALPSFDVIVAQEFHKLFKEYIMHRKEQGLSVPEHHEAFINISDRNSRARDGKGWQMPENTGIDFVADVDSNDISNNAKEMLMLGVAEQLVVLGGGPTVFRNLLRAMLMGIEVISCAFSNSKVGFSGATHAFGDFKKVCEEIFEELRKEKAKGEKSYLPEDRHPTPRESGYHINVIGSQSRLGVIPEEKFERVDLSDPSASKVPRFGLSYSSFKQEGDSELVVIEKIASFVNQTLNKSLSQICLSS